MKDKRDENVKAVGKRLTKLENKLSKIHDCPNKSDPDVSRERNTDCYIAPCDDMAIQPNDDERQTSEEAGAYDDDDGTSITVTSHDEKDESVYTAIPVSDRSDAITSLRETAPEDNGHFYERPTVSNSRTHSLSIDGNNNCSLTFQRLSSRVPYSAVASETNFPSPGVQASNRPRQSDRFNIPVIVNGYASHNNSESRGRQTSCHDYVHRYTADYDDRQVADNVSVPGEPDDEDFIKYVRKRTDSFYIGGFLRNVTEDIINSYTKRRGIKVTRIGIYRPEYSETAIVRLNVEPDSSEELTRPRFWPQEVICRPWLSKSRRNKFNKGKILNRGEKF